MKIKFEVDVNVIGYLYWKSNEILKKYKSFEKNRIYEFYFQFFIIKLLWTQKSRFETEIWSKKEQWITQVSNNRELIVFNHCKLLGYELSS